ncbi:hypothetical protein [Phytohabitans houttuyneae]|uniref:LamG-like jellyroll fold domain-containing protein n=1 Tax=Phytohabitans houttuyneae TaxID=1076126 RepID=A0A6V8KPC2_9ACTN|nr:hypothetical protein [Phytohabitans houttuyneae]GFJ84059.1 hypothetical protein Phou_082390 [Phytohabitans houttuyneae]
MAAAVIAVTASGAAAVAGPPLGQVELRYAGELLDPARVADSSGKGLHGAVSTGGGGAVTSVVPPGGDAFLRFPGGSCTLAPPCPQAIVTPAASTRLVPAGGRFSFGADIRLTEPPSPAAGMNVFQFGAAAAGLSQWKLQVDGGRPSCRWSDGVTAVLLPAGPDGYALTAGRWYRVSCWRLSRSVFQIRVDDPRTGRPVLAPGVAVAHLDGIVPTGQAVIGGKRVRDIQTDVDTDQFHGDLDNIRFARRGVPMAG